MSSQSWNSALITQQSDGPTLTAAAAATMLPGASRFTLPANFLQVIGQTLRITAAGKISTAITTPGTVRFDIRFGGTVVFDSLAILPDTVAAHSNVPFWLEILLTVRSIGAAAALMGIGKFTSEIVKGSGTMPLGSLVAMLPWNSPPTTGNTFDSTAAQQVDSFFTQTVTTGSMTLQQFILESLN